MQPILLITILLSVSVTATNTIHWFPCDKNGSIPFTCGTLKVPLDYNDPLSNKTLELALIKSNATIQPKKGSVLVNPGGPGIATRPFVAGRSGGGVIDAVGGAYDLIGFDTRGTGTTIPFACYNDSTSQYVDSLVGPALANSSNTAIGTMWSTRTIQAELCKQNGKEFSELIGTAYIARDMMQIVDALREDGLLRYWGISYGTILGATVAAMFPDRIDKLVLDGVVNWQEYYSGYELEPVADTDLVLAGFFEGCIASPETCALAKEGKTTQELSNKFYRLIDTIKFNPIALGSNITTDLYTYETVVGTIGLNLYSPSTWISLALALQGLLSRNRTAVVASSIFSAPSGTSAVARLFPDNPSLEETYGIKCSDVSLRTDNLTSLFPLFEAQSKQSRLGGEFLPKTVVTCAQWPFRAKERYSGNFKVKTKNPVLFIGNTADPATPFASAQNVSAGFEGSALLQHDGYGHGSLAQPSLCTMAAIRDYFANGTLPAPGTKCPVSIDLFSTKTLKDIIG